jgi:hypothetical protein
VGDGVSGNNQQAARVDACAGPTASAPELGCSGARAHPQFRPRRPRLRRRARARRAGALPEGRARQQRLKWGRACAKRFRDAPKWERAGVGILLSGNGTKLERKKGGNAPSETVRLRPSLNRPKWKRAPAKWDGPALAFSPLVSGARIVCIGKTVSALCRSTAKNAQACAPKIRHSCSVSTRHASVRRTSTARRRARNLLAHRLAELGSLERREHRTHELLRGCRPRHRRGGHALLRQRRGPVHLFIAEPSRVSA